MAFRADEAAALGLQAAKRRLIPRTYAGDRDAAEQALDEIVQRLGPVVDRYPVWHPLMQNLGYPSYSETIPSKRCGYYGLDHTVYFVNGFLTCPYDGGDNIIASINEHYSTSPVSTIKAEILPQALYNERATTVLVTCDWSVDLGPFQQIPKRVAVPLMARNLLKDWCVKQFAERWETIRPYLLGVPHGGRSSLFVEQQTAVAMKKTYLAFVESGMFGPVYDAA
tara:strand:+ start:18386 stop:19057 length:672 start_codon:yes stop_codon:yes gene_type:complete